MDVNCGCNACFVRVRTSETRNSFGRTVEAGDAQGTLRVVRSYLVLRLRFPWTRVRLVYVPFTFCWVNAIFYECSVGLAHSAQ